MIEPDLIVLTDAWTGYARLGQLGHTHKVVNRSKSDDPAHVVMPGVHRVASLLKRLIIGTYHGGIIKEHLDYDLIGYAFRFTAARPVLEGSSPTTSWKEPSIRATPRRMSCSWVRRTNVDPDLRAGLGARRTARYTVRRVSVSAAEAIQDRPTRKPWHRKSANCRRSGAEMPRWRSWATASYSRT